MRSRTVGFFKMQGIRYILWMCLPGFLATLWLLTFFRQPVYSQPCIQPANIDTAFPCSQVVDPVCGCDHNTYLNACIAENHYGVMSWTIGPCPAIQSQHCQAQFGWQFIRYGTVGFQNQSTGAAYYYWDFDDGYTTTAENPVHRFLRSDTFKVCLTVVDSTHTCFDTYCDNIIIPACVDSGLIDSSVICPAIYDPVCGCDGHTYRNACEAEKYGGITFYTNGPCNVIAFPVCNPGFNYQINRTPNGYLVTFQRNTPVSVNDSVHWDFGNGLTGTQNSEQVVYIQPGQYQVCLTVFNQQGGMHCDSTLCQSITVGDTCVDLSLLNNTVHCPVNYNPVCGCDGITYRNACIARYRYGVTSWTTGPCPAPGCQADFNFAIDTVQTTVWLTNASTGNYTHYYWDFGDGSLSVQQNPVYHYGAPGIYEICLTVYDSISGCHDVTCKIINLPATALICVDSSQIDSTVICQQVYHPVCGCDQQTYLNPCEAKYIHGVIDWTPGPCPDSTCRASFTSSVHPSGAGVVFQNTSSGNFNQVFWDFGDGSQLSNQNNPDHIYLHGGTYRVCLLIRNTHTNCFDLYCDTVQINGCVQPQVVDSQVVCPAVIDPVCGCDGVTYQNSCEAYYKYGVTYWTQGPCWRGNCHAYFTAHVDSSSPGRVVFQNRSSGQFHTVSWDFGNGLISGDYNPVVSYDSTMQRSYVVCLTIFDSAARCYDVYCDSVIPFIPLPCAINLQFNYVVSGDSVTFTSHPSTGGIFIWDFGDGTTASTNSGSVVHHYDTTGIYRVCLRYLSNNCDVSYCQDVNYTVSSMGLSGQTRAAGIRIYPNPFNDRVMIVTSIPVTETGFLSVYDITGRRIARIDEGIDRISPNEFIWKPDGVGPGIYLLRFSEKTIHISRKILYLGKH